MTEAALNTGPSSSPNLEKAGAFAERLLRALNDGALCLMISIGHRTGLFDALAEMPASTSAEIAARAGLNERYVREWLGAMLRRASWTMQPRRRATHCRRSMRRL